MGDLISYYYFIETKHTKQVLNMSTLTKKINVVKNFIVYAHDLRSKDETKEFQIKAKSQEEAKQYFLEDFPQQYWKIQEIELV